MPELFDGQEDATSRPDPTPNEAHPTAEAVPRPKTDSVGRAGTIVAAFALAAGYFWVGFPLVLLVSGLGVHVNPPGTASGLYLQVSAVLVLTAVTLELARLVHRAATRRGWLG